MDPKTISIPELDKFREKYPDYNDIDNVTLVKKLASNYPDAYGDLPMKHVYQFATAKAQEYDVDPAIIHSMIGVESSGNKNATSKKGAGGLMQLMPDTAKGLGVKDVYDEYQNVDGGVRYYKQMLDKFGGDKVLALAAYNAGPGNVEKYGNKPPPFQETRAYIAKVLGTNPKDVKTAVPDVYGQPEIPADLTGNMLKGAWNEATQPLPDRSFTDSEYWTNNLPRSVLRLPAAVVAGTGGMIYDAAKTFTDPVVNAASGKQPVLEAVSDFVQAPSTAARNALSGIGRTIAAPLGLMGKEEASKAWNDPAASVAAIAPIVAPLVSKARTALAQGPGDLTGEYSATIEKGISKSIRPGVEGKRTYGQAQTYYQRAENAVDTIIENKNSLKLTNEYGDVQPGTLPQSLKQFSQAIDQTKREVFNKYNQMATEAGETGAVVNLTPIVSELEKISTSTPIIDNAPGIAEYAAKRAEALKARGSYSTLDAQESISILNQSLESFYKNPSYESASRAYVDALIANNLRKGLDSVIEGISGEGYQGLKNQYGSLKAIERDVNRRMIVDARANGKGLIDFSDVFSGGEAVRGLLTMNPAMIGQAAAMKVIANMIKNANNPNRVVKNMFEKANSMKDQMTP
jgi:hypothetical protein